MNKYFRRQQGETKFKKRLSAYGLNREQGKALRATGKPCSCAMCSPKNIAEKAKYTSAKKQFQHEFKSLTTNEVLQDRSSAYNFIDFNP